ncbi:MAG: ferritin family protein [Gammaproteobacteria bacterium]
MTTLPDGDGPDIRSVEELLAHANALETEAEQRYSMLADQMEAHNNVDVALLFRKMAEIEGKHIQRVDELSQDFEVPHIAPWDLQWEGEAPEAIDSSDVHYLMTPYHALQLALRHEKRAADFFAELVETVDNEAVRKMARQLADEEFEHVRLLEEWLKKVPQPDEDWSEDPDPPSTQE